MAREDPPGPPRHIPKINRSILDYHLIIAIEDILSITNNIMSLKACNTDQSFPSIDASLSTTKKVISGDVCDAKQRSHSLKRTGNYVINVYW